MPSSAPWNNPPPAPSPPPPPPSTPPPPPPSTPPPPPPTSTPPPHRPWHDPTNLPPPPSIPLPPFPSPPIYRPDAQPILPRQILFHSSPTGPGRHPVLILRASSTAPRVLALAITSHTKHGPATTPSALYGADDEHATKDLYYVPLRAHLAHRQTDARPLLGFEGGGDVCWNRQSWVCVRRIWKVAPGDLRVMPGAEFAMVDEEAWVALARHMWWLVKAGIQPFREGVDCLGERLIELVVRFGVRQ